MSVRTTLLACLAVTAACATRGGDQSATDLLEETTEETAQFSLYVVNQNFYDATIYAIQNGYRRRVGIVGGHHEKTFQVEWVAPRIRFEIRLLAVGRTFSESLDVEPGDLVELTVPQKIPRRQPLNTPLFLCCQVV